MITESALKSWAMQQNLLAGIAVRDGGIHFTVYYMDSFDESSIFYASGLYDDGRNYYNDGDSTFYMYSYNYKIDSNNREKVQKYFIRKANDCIRKGGMSGSAYIDDASPLKLSVMPVWCNSIAEFETHLYKFLEVWRGVCLEARDFPGISFENRRRPSKDPNPDSDSFRYYPNNRSGGCYITTAVCQALGRLDDCYELNAFREYRDNWLIKQPDGKDIIREYYNIAPRIVETIDNLKDAPDIYKEIWNSYLNKCLTMIEEHRPYDCKKLYMDMVHDLRLKHNIN